MGLSDVFVGAQTWTDYISTREQTRAVAQQEAALARVLSQGLGALDLSMQIGVTQLSSSFAIGTDELMGGIEKLNADFNILMGEVIWKLQVQNSTLTSILATLQAPLDTAAKELRNRAVNAYNNGWFNEALGDFILSENRNYQDFTVHRYIANIYLYHAADLPRALVYFRKAAKYARPVDSKQAAEAHCLAGLVLGLLQSYQDAVSELRMATELNPRLHEGFYLWASMSAILREPDAALAALGSAVSGDARYFERATHDPAFDGLRGHVHSWQARIRAEEKARAARALDEARQTATDLSKGHYTRFYEDVLATIDQKLNQAEALLREASYIDSLIVTRSMRALRAVVPQIVSLDRLHAGAVESECEAAKRELVLHDVTRRHGRFQKERRVRPLGCGFALAVYVIPPVTGAVAVAALADPGVLLIPLMLVWPLIVPLTVVFPPFAQQFNDPPYFTGLALSAYRRGIVVGLLICWAVWALRVKWPESRLASAKARNAVKRARITEATVNLDRARAAITATQQAVRDCRKRIDEDLSAIEICTPAV